MEMVKKGSFSFWPDIRENMDLIVDHFMCKIYFSPTKYCKSVKEETTVLIARGLLDILHEY